MAMTRPRPLRLAGADGDEDEEARLAGLLAYRVLEGTGLNDLSDFDDLLFLTAEVMAVPLALVAVVDRDRVYLKAPTRAGADAVPRRDGWPWATLIDDCDGLALRDVRADPRFSGCRPVGAGPDIRFCAGAALRTPEGATLGTLWVIDHRLRELSDTDRRVLVRLAKEIMQRLELRRRALEAEEAGDAEHQSLAIVAHELRSSLFTISGYAELIDQEWSRIDDGRRHDVVQVIARQANRLSHMTTDLLDMARMRQGRMSAAPRWVPLRGALDALVAENGFGEVGVEGADAVAHVDPDHLHHAVVNLLANAQKYGKPPIAVRVTAAGNDAEIRVIDHGAGVPPDFEAEMFLPYTQIRSSETHRGLGLGLAVVRGLAEANGGAVWYEPGQPGACFVLRLPAAPNHPSTRSP